MLSTEEAQFSAQLDYITYNRKLTLENEIPFRINDFSLRK